MASDDWVHGCKMMHVHSFHFYFLHFLRCLLLYFNKPVCLRDVLPFMLKLPEAIASAKTQKELEEVAQLGAGRL